MNDYFTTLQANVRAWIVTTGARIRHDERGSFTIEGVRWAIAALGFVSVVVGAITFFLNTQVALLR